MNDFNRYKGRWIPILLLCLVVGILFAIRCYNREPSGDELLYEYVWEDDDPTWLWDVNHKFERKVSSFGDIWQTQVKHYFQVNGRTVVHTIEQAFTGHMMAFTVINTCVFLLFAWLIIYYVAPKEKRDSFALWLSVFMVLLLLFPYQESLWTSVNYGLNYLWPATMSVAVLILWDKISAGRLPSKYNIPVALFAFIFGWTHEGFVVGVAGAMFLYYCFNFRRFRGQILWLAIPMWISAAIMIFSPGNMLRFFGPADEENPQMVVRFLLGISDSLMCPISMTFILAVLIMLIIGKKAKVMSFMRAQIKLVLCFVLTFLFILIANTQLYSHTFVELTAFLLILRYICGLKWREYGWLNWLCAIVAILFISQQTIVARDTIALYHYHQRKVKELSNSTDDLLFYSTDIVSPVSQPFVRILGRVGNAHSAWRIYTIDGQRPVLLSLTDSVALFHPEQFFIPENKVPGTGHAYHKEKSRFFWIHPDSVGSNPMVEAEFYPVDWLRDNVSVLVRLKFLINPAQYESKANLKLDTINTRFGTVYGVTAPGIRRIKSINTL